MSESMIDEIPSSSNGIMIETDHTVKESGVHNEDEETWLFKNNKSKNDENIDNTTAPSIDEITTQEIDTRVRETTTGSQLDEDDSDEGDDIIVTIGNYEPDTSTFPTNRQKNRTMLTTNPMMPPKPSIIRGVDFDAQGVINGQPTYEYDILSAYKDEEKPWKKPGADISDYFNYGFTEETWAQYSDRHRRLRAENNLARLNVAHAPPIYPNHPAMVHPMNSHPIMMINKPMNMQMIPRPMNMRKPDGKIGVIGTTDQTSRRQMFEIPNNFEHPPFMNGPQFSGGQPPNGQTVGDLISSPPTTNGHPSSHGAPPNGTHHMSTLGVHRVPMMSLPHGMQFRPQFGHPHAPGGPQFFPRGPMAGMHGDRPPQPYFIAHHPQQSWDKTGAPPVHGFPPGSFLPQMTAPPTNNNNNNTNNNNGRAPSSRSPTPENHPSRSPTPEENRSNAGVGGETEKAAKDDRYKERYRDDREYHSSSHRRSSPKDRSSSSYRPNHRSSEHEYERPRNDRKSSRDRDDKYERYSRKRHSRDDSSRHHRGDDESSRSYHTSHRTPTKNETSPLKINPSLSTPIEPSQTLNEQAQMFESDPPISSSSPPVNRVHRNDSEHSSSRHSHHKKSSKRSRHDSGDERTSSHHHRRSKDQSSTSNKNSTNQTDSLSDVKDQFNE